MINEIVVEEGVMLSNEICPSQSEVCLSSPIIEESISGYSNESLEKTSFNQIEYGIDQVQVLDSILLFLLFNMSTQSLLQGSLLFILRRNFSIKSIRQKVFPL